MPRIRTIKPEFWSDEKMAPLEPIDRLTFLGLISMADDFGRVHDNVKVIDAFVFPECSGTVRESLANLSRIGRIRRGKASSGKQIIEIVNWSKHQRVDKPQEVTALPAIEDGTEEDQKKADVNTQENGVRESFANDSGMVPEPLATLSGIRDQGSGIRDRGSGTVDLGSEDSSEPEEPAAEPASATSDRSPRFLCSGRKHDPRDWQATDEQIDDWSEAYPAVDVLAELRRAKAWLDSNPTKRKTARGMSAFLNRWLSRQQDQGGATTISAARAGPKTFAQQRIENTKAAIEEFVNHEGF